ncbi:MAG: DNA topoisomerase (ATP-hydrolyzing) subunit A [Myxococcota bacterium]
MLDVQPVPLHEATRERYLAYALSVVTSRALPDVRDGLKPVQRRILYTMYNELGLRPDSRYRKCAAVVGDVMGKYHPHGDSSIYDALVRMAQDFTLRAPLVDGQGNFGSLDGDGAAAFRYTECRLRPLAVELLSEIKKRTVDFRPSYDGQRFEPIVLPAQVPQLLINGSEGIAVGMATRIPPHNLGEVVDATVHLIDNPDATVADLVQFVRGPDFPIGGRIMNDPAEILSFYENKGGSFRIRADWHEDKDGRRRQVILTSIPYGQNKAKLIEKIGLEVQQKRLPQVVDVRDESTDDVRVVLELKQGSSAEAVMAYLFKKTPLQSTFPMNLTALVPGANGLPRPSKLTLREILRHWLDFRFETIRRRFIYDLEQLRERIHLLEGFAIIFDCLDEAIAIIRASQGKRDAHEKLIERFELSDVQADAILELKLYKLAQLEILLVLEELEEKRAEAGRIEGILASDRELWAVVREELLELRKLYADDRRTTVGEPVRDLTFDENAYIVNETAYVVVTRDGWIKRQSSFTDIDKIRTRDGDEISWLLQASTRSCLTVFGSSGRAYVLRVDAVPATTGYGEPVQRQFAFDDGERVVGVVSHDKRHWADVPPADPESEDAPQPWALAVMEGGKVLRFALSDHSEVSTKRGRLYARPGKEDAVFIVMPVPEGGQVGLVSSTANALVFPTDDTPLLKAAGKGVTGIKMPKEGRVVAAGLVSGRFKGLTVLTNNGREVVVREGKFGGSRGNRGGVILKRGSIDSWVRPGPEVWIPGTDDPDADDADPTDDVPGDDTEDGGEE